MSPSDQKNVKESTDNVLKTMEKKSLPVLLDLLPKDADLEVEN